MKKNGTPIFGEWDSYFLAGTLLFIKWESQTPAFKILVRTLLMVIGAVVCSVCSADGDVSFSGVGMQASIWLSSSLVL